MAKMYFYRKVIGTSDTGNRIELTARVYQRKVDWVVVEERKIINGYPSYSSKHVKAEYDALRGKSAQYLKKQGFVLEEVRRPAYNF